MSDALCWCVCARERGEVKEMRGATGTWLTPRHACEAAVLLMVGRVGACQQQHAAESTAVSHQTQIHTHRQKCAHSMIFRHTLALHIQPPHPASLALRT